MRFFGLDISRSRRPQNIGQAARRLPVLRAEYSAAEVSRLFADWTLCHGYSPRTVAHEFPTMWGRGREALRNNPYMLQVARLYTTNVVGDTGIRLVPTALSSDGTLDDRTNRSTADAWTKWTEEPLYCDLRGRFTFRDILDLVTIGQVVEGEAWLRFVESEDSMFGLNLRLYGAGAVDVAFNETNERKGLFVFNGVQVDRAGRVVGYHMRKEAPGGMQATDLRRPAEFHEFVPASEMLHVCDILEESQYRGMPAVHAILPAMHMLAKYDDAELIAAREDACATGAYTIEKGSDYNPADSWGLLADGTHDMEPGEREVLPEGVKFDRSKPSRPNTAYGDFRGSVLRSIASGAGVMYEGLANDRADANYSSMREGKLAERDWWKMVQRRLVDHLCRPTYRRWVAAAIGAGQLRFVPGRFDQLYRHAWRPRRWPWVDPASDAQFYETCRRYGWKTDSQIADEIGCDWTDNATEIDRLATYAAGNYLETNYATTQETASSVSVDAD